MGSLWSSTPLMTASRLPWMNCGAANSPTKSCWTPRSSSWDWGHTSHGDAHDFRARAGRTRSSTTYVPDSCPEGEDGSRERAAREVLRGTCPGCLGQPQPGGARLLTGMPVLAALLRGRIWLADGNCEVTGMSAAREGRT